jgi:hypothetical protein
MVTERIRFRFMAGLVRKTLTSLAFCKEEIRLKYVEISRNMVETITYV